MAQREANSELRTTDGARLLASRQYVARRMPSLEGHQVSWTEVVKSAWRVGASTGTHQVSYCRKGWISKSLCAQRTAETFQSHWVLPPGMKSFAILPFLTLT